MLYVKIMQIFRTQIFRVIKIAVYEISYKSNSHTYTDVYLKGKEGLSDQSLSVNTSSAETLCKLEL